MPKKGTGRGEDTTTPNAMSMARSLARSVSRSQGGTNHVSAPIRKSKPKDGGGDIRELAGEDDPSIRNYDSPRRNFTKDDNVSTSDY